MGFFKRKSSGDDTDAQGGALGGSASTAEVQLNPGLPPLPTEFDALVEFAGNHIAAQQLAHSGAWGLGDAERFDVDLQAGTITWMFTDRNMMVTAPAQLLGTWNPGDQTFLWGWAHPSAPPGTAVAAQAVKDWADQNGVVELQDRKIECDNDTCYSIAGIASPIGDLQGVYRFDAGGPWAYVGFGNVTLNPVDPT